MKQLFNYAIGLFAIIFSLLAYNAIDNGHLFYGVIGLIVVIALLIIILIVDDIE